MGSCGCWEAARRRRPCQRLGIRERVVPGIRAVGAAGRRQHRVHGHHGAAGLSHALNVSGSPDNKQFLLEEMGCGVALFDYDNDGWLDIFLVNGSSFDEQARARRPTSYLFHNNRDGTFSDRTAKAGLTRSGWGQACCVGDYDNDGFDDLFVTYWGRSVLYHNNGDGTFTDVSERAGVAGPEGRWGAGCCFLDYDRDGHLDLFVSSYVNFDPLKAPRPGEAAYCRYNEIPVPCGPLGFAGGTNALYRNRGDGTFVDVSEASGIARPRGPSVDGVREQQLAAHGFLCAWARRPPTSTTTAGPTSTSPPTPRRACCTATIMTARSARSAVPAGCAFDENGAALAGMGVGVGDFDADGWLDIVRTNFSEQVTTLYRNYGEAFADTSIRAGLGVNRKYVGFGVGFFDFDNDGWKDLFIANGHVLLTDRGPEPAPHLPAAEDRLPQSGQRPLRRRIREGSGTPSGRRISGAAARSVTSTTTATSMWSSTTWTALLPCCATMAATGTTGS